MLNRGVPKSSKLGILGLFAIIVIGAIILPMGCGPARQTALETPPPDKIMDKIIVPGLRVGEYTFDMSKDDVLENLGKPETIFYGEERYTLDNLPRTYYMCFDDISFRIVDDSVKEIGVHSRLYKFTDGLGVGDSEQKIKQAFGDDFHLKETEWKDFVTYEDEGLVFEIDKNDRTVMEINVSPIESLKYESNAVTPDEFRRDFAQKVTQFDIDNADLNKIIDTFGQPLKYIWGQERLDKNNLPSRYVVVYPNGFQILVSQGKVVEIRFEHEQPKDYLFLGKLRVGSSLDEVFEVIGQPSKTVEGQEIGWVENVLYKDIDDRKGHCYYHRPDKNVRIFFGNYKVAALYITRSDYNAGGRGKVDIPPTSIINEQGRIVDKIDYPFINNSQAIGTWKSVDFVSEMEQFKPSRRRWKHGDLYLKELIILPNGRTFKPWWTWTKGLIFHSGDKTASKYTLKDIEGSTYMFFEWKSGDYTIRHRKPSYYVLKKISSETAGPAEARASLASIPPVVGTTKPPKQKAKTARILRTTARILRIEVSEVCRRDEEYEEDLDTSVSLAISLADLKAGNTQLPKIAKKKMDMYGMTLEGIIKMIESSVAPMIVLEWEEKIQTKSEEINTHVRISLE